MGWLNKRLSNRSERTVFLGALRRNVAWFRKLQPNISALLQDEEAADEVMWFLASVINECQREVITLVSPFADRGGTWITRLARLVSWIREWKDGTAIDLLDAILSKSSDLSFHQFNEFKEMAQLDAGRTIRVIERLLWRILRDVIAKGGGFSDVINALDNLQTDVDDAFAIVAEADPVTWLRAMLPWLEEVFDKTTWASESEHSFRYDGAAFYGSGIEGTDDSLLNSLRRALVLTARAEVDTFHGFTERLKQLRYQSAQSLLGGAYAELGESYANEALEFLLGDHRRLWLGGSAQVTRRALAGISPHLAAEQREHLEDAILAHKELKPESVEDLRKRFGYERYNLLSAIPSQLLSTRARRLLQEFQRKFPNVDLSFGPPKIRVVWESPPIPRDKAVKMRDSDWLRAIERHTSGPANSEPLRTSRALAEILKDEIKKQPDRFAALSAKLPEDADEDYVCAFIDGLAEAHVASDSVFRLIHRFRNRSEPDIRRTISWVLEKKKRIPPDLVDLLEGWVRDPSIDDEYAATSLDYLNVVRGAAFLALMNGLREDASSEKRERRWRVLEYVASDGSPALRAAALEELRYELYEERDRAWDVFEKTMRYGRDAALLGLPRLFSFLHAGIWKTFSRTLPYALALLRASDEKLQKRGAQLIAVGAVSPNALTEQELSMARELLTEIVVGPAMQRDAAADVLAHNVDTPVAEFCWQLLIKLVDDTDKNVRIAVSQVFERMVDRDLVQRSSFLYQYARSATLGEGIRSFSEFLFTHGMTAPDLALDLVEAALQNNQQGEEGKWYDGADLIRVVLRIDASTLTEELTKKRAMDTFDKLMEKYGNFADRVLAEWDRR